MEKEKGLATWGWESLRIWLFVLIKFTNVTDGHVTDGQTPHDDIAQQKGNTQTWRQDTEMCSKINRSHDTNNYEWMDNQYPMNTHCLRMLKEKNRNLKFMTSMKAQAYEALELCFQQDLGLSPWLGSRGETPWSWHRFVIKVGKYCEISWLQCTYYS